MPKLRSVRGRFASGRTAGRRGTMPFVASTLTSPENLASLLSHFRLQVWCQSLDLIVLFRMVAELRLEMPWSPSYDPSKFENLASL